MNFKHWNSLLGYRSLNIKLRLSGSQKTHRWYLNKTKLMKIAWIGFLFSLFITSVRSFTFTDDVDFLIAKVTLEHNPYNSTDQDQHWSDVVSDLQIRDPNLKTVNTRMVKKRVRFLIDRYMANINGK